MNKIFIEKDKEVKEAVRILLKDSEEEGILSCDSESDGFDGRRNKLWSVQLGTRNDSFLFPWNALNQKSRDLLRKATSDRIILAHNAKHDYKFLTLNGFQIGGTYCTFETEKIMFQGKYFTFGLKDLLFRRFQIKMDKEVRSDFYDGTFAELIRQHGDIGAWLERPDLQDYALDDIVYIHELYDAQQVDLKELGMEDLAWLENNLVPVVGDTEKRGVGLDYEATKKFESKVTLRRDEISAEMLELLGNSYNIRYQKIYKAKMQLWDSWKLEHERVKRENSERDVNDKRRKPQWAKDAIAESNKKKPFQKQPEQNKPFNPNSHGALKDALSELLGYELETTAKEWLEENTHLHEAVALVVEYRKFEKLVQFCQLKDELNPVTGLIHASFHQNGTKSGRFSCSEPNLQQIPAKTEEAKEFRALFRPLKGHKFVGADLAGIELVILAYFAEEEGLLAAINEGKDVHCYTMSHLLNCEYEILVSAKDGKELDLVDGLKFDRAVMEFYQGFTMPELQKIKDNPTKWVKTFRDYVKTITYGLAYGMSPWGLSRKFHCEYEVAELFMKRYFDVYGKLKVFLKEEENLGLERQYAVNPLGRRRWFSAPKMKSYKQVEEELIKWFDKQGRLWDSIEDDEWDAAIDDALKAAKKEYNGKIGYIKRQAGNFFPQSMCADMVKLAMVVFSQKFPCNETEGICLTIHDELIVQAKDENAELAASVLKESMEYAVHKFMPEVLQDVQCDITDYWKK